MPAWNTDAQFARDIDDRFIATNAQIESFLHSRTNEKTILIAAKGMGKTLLLRHKRHQLDTQRRDFYLIPRNNTADYVTLPTTPTKGLLELMKEHQFWEDIWIISIVCSVLLHYPHGSRTQNEIDAVADQLDAAELPLELRHQLMSAFRGLFHNEYSPSAILDLLIQSDFKALARARAMGLQRLQNIFVQYVTSGCAVFIDSFDQAVSTAFPESLPIWCSGQTGLLKAVFELSRRNPHVKIFATIRQEAFSNFKDPVINSIRGSALLIEYSDDDLRKIFEKAISHYESGSSLEEFIGVDKIYNGYLKIKEESFAYISRHTIGVPRWLMVIGEALSFSRNARGLASDVSEIRRIQKTVSRIVGDKSAELCRDYLIAEMSAFYGGDLPERFIDLCISQIGSTVLSISTLRRLSQHLIDAGWSGTTHPFCLLYNLGLLGYVKRDQRDELRQHFTRPYQFDWAVQCLLPKDAGTRFLLHPAMHGLVQAKNTSFRFNSNRIGIGLQWRTKDDERLLRECVRTLIYFTVSESEVADGLASRLDAYLKEKSVIHDIWLIQRPNASNRQTAVASAPTIGPADHIVLVVSKASCHSEKDAAIWNDNSWMKISKYSENIFPVVYDELPAEEIPIQLRDLCAYKVSQGKDVIRELVDAILYGHNERSSQKTRQSSSKRQAGSKGGVS